MLIGSAEIRRLIPHAGGMCLIDTVLAWDSEHIRCLTASHRRPDHPLRRDGRLSAVHAFEYGAQAAAIHGALLARSAGCPPIVGYLGTLRRARLALTHLETIEGNLHVSARLLLGDHGNAIYECQVAAADAILAEARITIVERPALEPCGDI